MSRRWIPLFAVVVIATALTPHVRENRAAAAPVTWTGSQTVFAAGDIGRCAPDSGDELTANIVAGDPNAHVWMLGDAAYPGGTDADFADCYAPTWGGFLNRTWPVPGNHDYENKTEAPGYYNFFGSRINDVANGSGNPAHGYYSFDVGPWHIIGLNSNCGGLTGGCDQDGEQGQWFQADLAKAQAKCMVALWHHPRFFSAAQGDGKVPEPSQDTKMASYWRRLHAAGADIVLGSHDHLYERFARMGSPETAGDMGVVDPTGPRQFVAGLGGGKLQPFVTDKPVPTGSEYRLDQTYGVLKLVLHEDWYDWQFLAVDGTVRDSGTDTCTPGQTAPTTTSTAPTTPTSAPGSGGGPGPTSSTTVPGGVANNLQSKSGYWMVGDDGRVYAFGDAVHFGDAVPSPGAAVVDLEPTPTQRGYWTVDTAGKVSAFGDAGDFGSVTSFDVDPGEKVSAISSTRSGRGYWIFTDRGRAFVRGNAVFYGDMRDIKLNGKVLDSITSFSGQGYYMVASDGGIFSFGNAVFYGSMGNVKLNAPVMSLVPDADNSGYWLVASDGGIFAFMADFRGSMGSTKLNRPVTGMVRFGDGYLMVSEDGGIFNFSSKQFHGSLGATPPTHPVTSVAALN